jgi:hypothetical protein
MDDAYTTMRSASVERVDLRIRSDTLLELHAGLAQLWMYCVAREIGAPTSPSGFEINVLDVTHEVIETLTCMFRKAGVAFFLNADPPTGCCLGAYRTIVSQYSLAFTLLSPPATRCSRS